MIIALLVYLGWGLVCAVGQIRAQIDSWGRVRLWDWVAFSLLVSPFMWFRRGVGIVLYDWGDAALDWIRIHAQSRGCN